MPGCRRISSSGPQASLTPKEYFALWRGIEQAAGNHQAPLLLAEHFSVELFDPPIFASICSPDLNTALRRLQHYKPLIGPLVLDLYIDKGQTLVAVRCDSPDNSLPLIHGLMDLVFFTQLARMATRHHVVPLRIEVPELPGELLRYQDYFGCPLSIGPRPAICFANEDASRPFLSANSAMWEFFEDKLSQKLSDLDDSATTVDRVRAVLVEALPGGDSTIDAIAGRLAMSKRTLQRKLTAEAANFQGILNGVRHELADHYLAKSQLPLAEIAFLLGFRESNSFIRAYSHWKGMSPGRFREQAN